MHYSIKSILLLAVTASALSGTGCKKEHTPVPSGSSGTASVYNQSRVSDTCPDCCSDLVQSETLYGTWKDSAIVIPNPSAWDPIYFNFCTGEVDDPGDAHFRLDGRFNSTFTSLGGVLGYYDSSTTPPSSIDGLTCGSLISLAPATSIGSHGAQQGWFIYNFMNPMQVNASWLIGIRYDGCAPAKEYVVRLGIAVQTRLSGTTRQYRSVVTVDYICVSPCTS